ncbi:MAG: hypothetical protein PHF00_10855 [Elusimicrobia bacterium]|nr:hypothetical protein [Elusimicrobiota bacterium]
MVRLAALCLLLALPARAAEPAAKALDDDTLAMVRAFLKTPTSDLPAEHVPRFLEVDPQALPPKLRRPFRAKRLELYTLKQIADGKRRGSIRMPEADCLVPKDATSAEVGILGMAGYVEITDDDELFLMRQTKCTEHDLMCEFSLRVVLDKENKINRRRLFLHVKDPMMGLVGMRRAYGSVRQTNFFGAGFPSCASRLK